MDSRLRRHWRWLRTDGLSAYLEEHDLNPAVRIPRDLRKVVWERTNGSVGHSVPVFVVGAQRSGTNMLTHGLQMAPDVRVYNEGNGRAFDHFRLKPLVDIQRLIAKSASRVIVFKPLCDSHRIDQILRDITSHERPRALWVWRRVEGRVRSTIAKFSTSNLQVLQQWAAGTNLHDWQVQRLSNHSRAFLSSLDIATMSSATAAAAFWYIRNNLYFDLQLDRRDDVIVVSYDMFVREPERWMRSITNFTGLEYRRDLIEHVKPTLSSRHTHSDLNIDAQVLARCHELGDRLRNATFDRMC